MRPTRALVDLSAIRHNMLQIRHHVPAATAIIAVVKADAYGHGAVAVSHAALSAGANCLAVAIPEEGAELRESGITCPIFVLGLPLPEQAALFIEYNLTATVCTNEELLSLSREAGQQGKRAHIVLKADTGMTRIGLPPEQIPKFLNQVLMLPHIDLQGIFTHLASADAADKTYAEQQLVSFNQAVQAITAKGITLPYISAANSAALIDMPNGWFNAVRPGIILYGLPPSDEMRHHLNLRPAMQLVTKVTYLKQVPACTKIGYGCTYTTRQPSMIATLPIGYADGYSRHLSNKADVLLGGHRYPVAGRVCMDQLMVDLGPACHIKIGDEAVLFGRQGDGEITVTELAAKTGTINYELVCAVSPRVPRIYLNAAQEKNELD